MRPFLTAVLLAACGGTPEIIHLFDAGERRDAGVDAGAPRDAGFDGGNDAGTPDTGTPDAGFVCDGGCGVNCAVCSPIQRCEAGACAYFNRIRFRYLTDLPDANGFGQCVSLLECINIQDFAIPRALGIVETYRDAGCSSVTLAGDGVGIPDQYNVDCSMPFCIPRNPSNNCCRTFTPGGLVRACGWTAP